MSRPGESTSGRCHVHGRRGHAHAAARRGHGTLRVVCSAALLFAIGGCKIPGRQDRVRLDSAAGIYDSAHVTYRLDASKLCEPMAIAKIEGQLVSYQDNPSSPVAGSARGVLTVDYPHPAGRVGFARCRVVIESHPVPIPTSPKSTTAHVTGSVESGLKSLKSPWSRNDMIYESWTLDVPKIELDRAIGQVNESGFFSGKMANGEKVAGVDIDVTLDGAHVHRQWRTVGGLDELMLHVRRAGQLESYRRPEGMAQNLSPRFTSVLAYQDFHRAEADAQQMLAQRAGGEGAYPPGAYSQAAMPGQSQYPVIQTAGNAPWQPGGLSTPAANPAIPGYGPGIYQGQPMYQAQPTSPQMPMQR
ncbi:MAG TPA: hypothetical protein VHZ24_11865 [Pirellulales bacterium]|nr:hypothetical protein [Pirellulales bacterium]